MSVRAAAYQAQISGRAGEAFVVNGVKFDGISTVSTEGLLEAKGPGYANFVKGGQFKPFFKGADELVSQAQRQLAAANGTPVTWHVAEPEAATAIRNLFKITDIRGINVVNTPPAH
jgi:filamentous hemagglutinin